jgi:hypothetical protein
MRFFRPFAEQFFFLDGLRARQVESLMAPDIGYIHSEYARHIVVRWHWTEQILLESAPSSARWSWLFLVIVIGKVAATRWPNRLRVRGN